MLRRGSALVVLLAALGLLVPGSLSSGPAAAAQAVAYVDPLYGYTLQVPDGWFIEPTPANATYGIAAFYNHNPNLLETSPSLPIPNPIKIQIGIGDIAPSASFHDWIAQRVQSEFAAERGIAAASGPTPVALGKLSGQALLLHGGAGPAVLELDFPVGSGKVLSLGVTPGDSGALPDAFAMLSTIEMPPDLAPDQVADPAAANNLARNAAPVTGMLEGAKAAPAAVQQQCSPGVYNGNEAPGSPIEIWMPFRDGETWQVGGGGAFYGNYFHCNFYNDYYATDWNRPNDAGADVLPIANGTVSAVQGPPCPNTGYGCYVTINHSNGVRSLYAHLSAVFVSAGATVNHWDRIGTVGNSGNSTGAHLHLRFQASVNGVYYSHCYNNSQTCPNGEAPVWPQSPRPSPMNTAGGAATLQYGASYTSNNRQTSTTTCPTVSGEVAVYDLVDCGGESVLADGPGLWTMVYGFNDRAESIAIPSGWSARVYLHDSTDSPSVCVPQTAHDLRDYHLSDGQTAENKITWMMVYDKPNCDAPKPDLAPYPLPNRQDPVIASPTSGTNQNAALSAGRVTYMDWGFRNAGVADASAFYVDLYIDGQRYIHYPWPGLNPGESSGFPDWAEVWHTPGWHAITLVVDPDDTVDESNEGNNVWAGQFYWQPTNPRYLPVIYK
jgi:hypothetical protein